MDDATAVRICQRPGDLAEDARHLVRRQWTGTPHAVGKCLAVDVGHRDEHDRLARLDGMDRHDVRMRETGRGACLAQESLAKHGLRRHHRGEQLERHGPFEREIASEQDDSHPAAAKLALDRVAPRDRALEALKVGDGLAHLHALSP